MVFTKRVVCERVRSLDMARRVYAHKRECMNIQEAACEYLHMCGYIGHTSGQIVLDNTVQLTTVYSYVVGKDMVLPM